MASPPSGLGRSLDIMLPQGGSVAILFEAYFDESYTDDGEPASFLALGGYLLQKEKAQELEADWRKILDEAKIPYFHCVDFGPGKHELYRHLSKARRIEIQSNLIALIHKHVMQGFAIIINPRRFAEEDLAEAYSFCAHICTEAMGTRVEALRLSGDIAYVFENGHEKAGAAWQYLSKLRGDKADAVTFAAKEKTPILQAADLFIWHVAKYVKDQVTGARAPRADMRELVKQRHALAFVTTNAASKEMLVSWVSEAAPDATAQKDFLRAEFGS